MSGIAHMMLDAGIEVSGSDRSDSAYLDKLRARGARIAVGHDAANLGRRRHHRLHDGPLARQPGVPARAGSRTDPPASFAGPALALARPPGGHGRGSVRQDHLDRDDRHHPRAAGCSSRIRQRRRRRDPRCVERDRLRRGVRARRRRIRRIVHALRHRDRPDHERRRRPSRSLRIAGPASRTRSSPSPRQAREFVIAGDGEQLDRGARARGRARGSSGSASRRPPICA